MMLLPLPRSPNPAEQDGRMASLSRVSFCIIRHVRFAQREDAAGSTDSIRTDRPTVRWEMSKDAFVRKFHDAYGVLDPDPCE